MEHLPKKQFQRSESFLVSALLAAAGGLLDAYTYLSRGGVFANAETGNIVLLGLHLARGQWRTAGTYLLPLLAFAAGVLAAELIRDRHPNSGRYHWRHTILLAEIAVICVVAFLPLGSWDMPSNAMVAFVCALQVETFRKVRGNAFASTMCTGNLRSGTEALYHGLVRRDRTALEKALCYYGIIGCFIAGAALGAFLTGPAPQRAVLGAAALQSAAFVLMWGRDASPA